MNNRDKGFVRMDIEPDSLDGYMYPETGEDEINRWEPQALLVQKACRPDHHLGSTHRHLKSAPDTTINPPNRRRTASRTQNHLMEAKPGEISGIR